MTHRTSSPRITQPDAITLAKAFVRIGATSFGGWSTTAVLIEQEFVERRKALRSDDLKTAITYAQVLPGATQVAIVANCGHRILGQYGAVVATVAYLMPAIALIVAFAALYFTKLQDTGFAQHLNGLIAALAGIILANAYRISSKHVSHWAFWLVVAAVAVIESVWHLNAFLIIITLGGAGLLISVLGDKYRHVRAR